LRTPARDRTMRVEVDLYNGTEQEYKDFLTEARKNNFQDLKDGVAPLLPQVEVKGGTSNGRRLMPGMYGDMKLVLRRFDNAHLVPTSAVFSKGGRPYVYVIKDHKAVLVAVEVQVNDGQLSKILILENVGGTEVRRELNGQEEIVLSNQGELSEGQRVETTKSHWRPGP
jgi:multidrug efflux pump subunit AcrA (membrane-fusion protein)